ncbi:MAG: exodeoxyribonuclease VII small subunit [Alphaproteobacteria bacterium]|nr:exodeoxyribonuclease VII small subunit [Alphaproteobacteria bacterium]
MPKSTAQTGAEPTIPADIAKLSFEEAMAELDKLVRQLEDGKAKLDDAIGAYERGSALKRHCEARLRDARMKIEKIALTANGPAAAPFEE